MSQHISLDKLGLLLNEEQLKRPHIGDEARRCVGKAAEAIEAIGLPTRFADSFQAIDEVSFFSVPKDCTFNLGQRSITFHRAVEIGKTEFGSHIVECDTGCVVYIDSSGTTQLINTSVDRFLFFVGRFRRSAKHTFKDSEELLADCKRVDEVALADPESMWSVMIEEARAGLY